MKIESKISILNGLFLTILFSLALFEIVRLPLFLPYTWHKLFHIIGVILFFGNMVVGPFWVSYAIFSKDQKVIEFSFRLLRITDIYLTIIGLDLLVLNGLCLSSVFGGLKNQAWIFYSVVSLFFMWGLSIPVIFIQEKLYESFEKDGSNSENFRKYVKLWAIFGSILTIPPSIAFYFMIAKNN